MKRVTLCAFFALALVGCTALYKPDIEIKDSQIESMSGNKGSLKGEYNAK